MDIRFDSVAVKAGHFCIIHDSAVYVTKDTVFFLADTVDYYQTKNRTPEKADNFFKSVGSSMSKNRVSRFLYKRLFSVRTKKKDDVTRVEVSENPYMKYDGKVIDSFTFRYLDIFGTSIIDTTKRSKSSFVGFMNKLHFHTRQNVVVHNLLLNEGTVLHPTELADNERVLRTLPFIKDARIMVEEPDSNSYKVNLHVVTKDVFPLKFDISSNVFRTSLFGVSNINLFGTGHELETNWITNDLNDGSFGYDHYYRIPNIKGLFVTSEFNYANSFNKEGVGVRAFRGFLTPEIKYAGGVELNSFKRRELRLDNGQIVFFPNQMELDSGTFVSFRANEQDIWFGRSYRSFYNPPAERVKERLRLLMAARINRVNFTDRPEVRVDQNRRFHDRTRFLGSIGFSSRRYYKDRLIKAFGRTEDIPAGNVIQLTGGYEVGEFGNRPYFGAKLAKGKFFKHFGYLRGEIQSGGFFKSGRFEQGVVKTRFNYFTHLYTLHFFKIRQFFDLDYTVGVRRFEQEVIDINEENGLRGLNSAFLAGTQRLSLKFETVVFTPLYLASFRVATFGFADVAWIDSNRESPFAGETFSSLGLGIRLRNDNLAFSTIEFSIAFLPNTPIDSGSPDFSLFSQPILPFDDFDLREPNVLEFR